MDRIARESQGKTTILKEWFATEKLRKPLSQFYAKLEHLTALPGFFPFGHKESIDRVENPVVPRGSNVLRSFEVETSLPTDVAKALSKVGGLGSFKSPCLVAGRSGVRHSFTFGYEVPPAPNVVGDLVIGKGPVDETKVLSLFIKVYDVGARHAVLCVVPSLTAEAKKLSNLYKIVTVESSDRTRLSTMTLEVLGHLSKSK